MFGNWSFGDYFKREAIEWSFEFLTKPEWLGLDPKRIYVTVFKGEEGIPRDEDAIQIWKETFFEVGIKAEVAGEKAIIKDDIRIIPLGKEDNFWIAASTGPGGGDTEMFYDTRPEEGKLEGEFSDLVKSGRILEIWNDVFMEFNKTAEGKYEKLMKPNVDTGMGLERTLAVLNDKELVFDTELFQPIFLRLEKISGNNYEESEETKKSFRIISDHIKTGVFMIADGVIPSNVDRGYVLRRLIRRAIRHGKLLGMEKNFTKDVAEVIVEMYKDFYPELGINKVKIFGELEKEENKFRKTLADGLAKIEKYLKNPEGNLIFRKIENEMQQAPVYFHSDAVDLIFDLYQTDGFPLEMALEELKKKAISLGVSFDEDKLKERFNEKFKQHQELSRTASAGMFKGGLQSQDEQTTRLHTATHLLQAALRQVLGTHVYQKGSNITPERLRFDFSHPEKMTPEQIKRVEDLVNVKIKENLGIKREEMTPEEAKTVGALGVFEAKYGDRVSVYSAGSFSKEICGGPHVKSTGELGHFKIKKEEASSAGVRRIKAVLE
jgi:alanyl-tRNA synthetase